MVTAVTLEIFRNIFSSIAAEMGSTLERTASSPNIKERRDFSCAIFDGSGDLIAQAAHIPVHLGSMPLLVKKLVRQVAFSEGDMIVNNDPYGGGTHLPDITVVAPLFNGGGDSGRPTAYVANRAHHSDIGGIAPGSMPLSTEIFQEGIRVPSLHLMRNDRPVPEVWDLIDANVRTPGERRGDLEAQVAANRRGMQRLREVLDRYGLETLISHQEALLDYSERLVRSRIAKLPRGTFAFDDRLEGYDGEPVQLRVSVTIAGEKVVCDFAGSAPAQKSCLNCPRAVTQAAVYYAFRCLLGDDIPPNSGCFRPLEVRIPEDCVLDASFPSAVAGGNVETSQRIVDLVFGALAGPLPGIIPAASQGTMNNLSFGGYDEERRRYFAYYETIGGGAGASLRSPGESGIQTHMTNTQNTPIEVLEMEYPLQVMRYSMRKSSGGKGACNGGEGLRRDIMLKNAARATILSERRNEGPYGLAGGSPGSRGENVLIRSGKKRELPSKCSIDLEKGDILSIRTPGGGGWGS